jgi:hypothetical protein
VKHAAVKHSARAARRAKTGAGAAPSGAVAGGEVAAGRSGTQRPGGRRWLAQLPYWVVAAGVVAGLATIRSGGQAVKGGTLVIAGALLAGSLIRLVLPDGGAGMLASRRRFADVAVLGALGIGLLVAGLLARVTS